MECVCGGTRQSRRVRTGQQVWLRFVFINALMTDGSARQRVYGHHSSFWLDLVCLFSRDVGVRAGPLSVELKEIDGFRAGSRGGGRGRR